MNDFLATATAWLAAFLLHSTLWLGGVALFVRLRPGLPAIVRDFLWRAALVASLLTPTAQTIAAEAFGWQPLGGALRFGAQEAEVAATPLPALAEPPPAEQFTGRAALLPAEGMLALTLAAVPPPPPAVVPAEARGSAWMPVVFATWAAIAACGIAVLARGTWRFRAGLGAREPVGESASARALRKLLERAGPGARGVRLTTSDGLRVPVALGVFRREICVPRRALRDLPPPQQRAMIGHELAHLLRRDPAWLGGFELARRLFFFQPLLVLAQRGAHEAAEELCDAWSARRTGDPVALAECLVEVARWLEPRGRREALPLAAACMARPDSPLARRIDALLATPAAASTAPPERASHRLRIGICAAALGIAALAPGFTAGPGELSLEARFARVTAALAEVHADLAAARAESAAADDVGAPRTPSAERRLAALGTRLEVLRAQADTLSALIQR